MPASGLEEDLRSASASQPPLFSTTSASTPTLLLLRLVLKGNSNALVSFRGRADRVEFA